MDERNHEIEFTQYLRPNGRRELVKFKTTQVVFDKAKLLEDAGYIFEIEVLHNGMVSATIGDPAEETDVAFALQNNGPQLPAVIDKMILDFKPIRVSSFAKD